MRAHYRGEDRPAKPSDREEKLTGAFRHSCPDWDFLLIDETCPEFTSCLCFIETGRESRRNEK